PRIVAEVALPWRALGVDGPPAAGQLRMELAATSYHRARWMSWSGLPPAASLQDTTRWHTVRLRRAYANLCLRDETCWLPLPQATRHTETERKDGYCVKVHVRVGTSRIAGQGLFAAQDINKGTRIIQYIGQKISKEETADRLYQGNQSIF